MVGAKQAIGNRHFVQLSPYVTHGSGLGDELLVEEVGLQITELPGEEEVQLKADRLSCDLLVFEVRNRVTPKSFCTRAKFLRAARPTIFPRMATFSNCSFLRIIESSL